MATDNEAARGLREKNRRITQHPLPFPNAITRLKHSFITLTRTFQGLERVNFKHPSLRDLLLGELRNDPSARRRYIELTSPIGLAKLIQGLATKKMEQRSEELRSGGSGVR